MKIFNNAMVNVCLQSTKEKQTCPDLNPNNAFFSSSFFQQTFIPPVCTINYLYKNRVASSINDEINNKINKVQTLITRFHTL